MDKIIEEYKEKIKEFSIRYEGGLMWLKCKPHLLDFVIDINPYEISKLMINEGYDMKMFVNGEEISFTKSILVNTNIDSPVWGYKIIENDDAEMLIPICYVLNKNNKNMKKVDNDFLKGVYPNFIKECTVQITLDDLEQIKRDSKAVYYAEYLTKDEYRAVRISERIKCQLQEFGSNNKAALYIIGDPDMDEVAEILDGLHEKTDEIIWGNCENSSLETNELKVMLLFYEI